MTIQATLESEAGDANPEQIAQYLSSHPEFFDDHPELVAELRLSHSSGNAVSLIERQIKVLRDQNTEFKNKLRELIDVARDNDRLNQRMHEMTLGLLKATSPGALMDTLDDHLRNEFSADAVSVHLTARDAFTEQETAALRLDVDDTVRALFQPTFQHNRSQCGRLGREQLDFLFRDHAEAIQSAVVVPLGTRAECGILAVGSRDADRFNAGMDTLFMNHLGELVTGFLCRRSDTGLMREV